MFYSAFCFILAKFGLNFPEVFPNKSLKYLIFGLELKQMIMDNAINDVKTSVTNLVSKINTTPKEKITADQVTGLLGLLSMLWSALTKLFPKL